MDSLDEIRNNFRRGSAVTIGISNFCKAYKRHVDSFLMNLQKSVRTFESELLREKGITTTAISLTTLTGNLDEFVKGVAASLSHMQGDLIEPLESFGK